MSSKRLGYERAAEWTEAFDNLLCYRELVCTGVTSPFVVSSLSRNDEDVRAIGTEQHSGPVIPVKGATTTYTGPLRDPQMDSSANLDAMGDALRLQTFQVHTYIVIYPLSAEISPGQVRCQGLCRGFLREAHSTI
jgi:hypothetical protein